MKNKGRVTFYKDKAGEWRWNYKAPNGRIMADSAEGYSSKRNAIRAWRKFGDYIYFFYAEITQDIKND